MTRRDRNHAPGPHAQRQGVSPARPAARTTSGARSSAAPADRATADGALRASWLVFIVMWALRLALAFVPNMWGWGLNLQRFLALPLAWLPWVLGALALIPRVARAWTPPLDRIGDALVGRASVAGLFAVLTAALMWGSPDNLRSVGDFLLRQGTVEMGGDPATLFPQALPLDVALHYHLPRALQNAGLLAVNQSGRLYGALDAALLSLLAVAFARTLALRGLAALAAWSAVLFGGYLGLFTGYNKSLAELVVLVVAVGVFGMRLVREGRGALALGAVLALALALHRSSLALIPAATFAWIVWMRRTPGAWKRPTTLAALALPLATLALLLPRMLATLLGYDRVHVGAADAAHHGLIANALEPVRFSDLMGLTLALAPLALPALLVRGLRGSRTERWMMLTLALPLAEAMFWVHPVQGAFRDWDVFAPAAAALALASASRIGRQLGAAGARRWVGVAVIAVTFLPTVQWLAHFTSVEEGFRRIEAFATEAPRRTDNERGLAWDFIGIRNYRLRRLDDAVRAWATATDITPAPRIFEQWARGEIARGDLRAAQQIYHRMLARDSTDAEGWLELAELAQRIPDAEDLARATARLRVLRPGGTAAHSIGDYVGAGAVARDSVRRGTREP